MKSLPFIVAIAALLLGSFATIAEATAEAKVVHISQRYSKAELDAICTQEGGSAYGGAEDIYGCAKGSNIAACSGGGICTGYISLPAISSRHATDLVPIMDWDGNAELVLQMPVALPKAGLDNDPDTAQ